MGDRDQPSFLPAAWNRGFLERIATCNRADLSRYVPLRIDRADRLGGGERVGAVRNDRVADLAGSGIVAADAALWLPAESADERSERLAALVARLAAAGRIRAATGELYAVGAAAVGAARRAVVDRAAVAWLGIAATGVHVNGFTRGPAGISMWVARRSRTKPTFPGELDNMVAGGQAADLGYVANVIKECGEEAGIPAELARAARPVGAVRYVFENATGLKPDTMFCFDLELPGDFVPTPTDGEVESFEPWPIARVAERVASTAEFKFNCNLVVVDFLVRHGLLDPDDDDYARVVHGLHQGPPRFPGD